MIKRATTNNYPIVDVSAAAAGATGIRVAHIDYVTVQNFNIRGSGGGGSAAFQIDYASGTGGSGYTNTFTDINVLSNYGAASGNNDCIGGGSATGETAQGIFNNITANECRRNPQAAGSQQCFTLHAYSAAQVDGFYCTDSNYGMTNTKSAQLTASNITMSDSYV